MEIEKLTQWSVEAFQQKDKKVVVKSLLAAHPKSPHILIVLSQMCITYKVFDHHIWDTLIIQMIQLNMVISVQLITVMHEERK